MNSVFTDVARCLVEGPRREGDTYTAAFVFPDTFSGFDGHFPGNPVVPGIAQIFAAQVALGDKYALGEIKRCKFMRPVLPGERMVVAATMSEEADALRCKAEANVDGAVCASVNFTLVLHGENA